MAGNKTANLKKYVLFSPFFLKIEKATYGERVQIIIKYFEQSLVLKRRKWIRVGTMKRNKFSETRKNDIKSTTCTGLMSVSKICSFSKLMQNRLVSEKEKSNLLENKTLEVKTHQKENYDKVCKTPIFSLPTLIRIRATDKEGNTIEVTY